MHINITFMYIVYRYMEMYVYIYKSIDAFASIFIHHAARILVRLASQLMQPQAGLSSRQVARTEVRQQRRRHTKLDDRFKR